MNEDFLFNARHGTDVADFVQRQFSRQNDPLEPHVAQSLDAFAVMHRHLRAAVQAQGRKVFADNPRRAQILHDDAVGFGIPDGAKRVNQSVQFFVENHGVDGDQNALAFRVGERRKRL